MNIKSSSPRNNRTPQHSPDHSLVTTSQEHLPSVDVRTTMPLVKEDVRLRDYIDVLLRRKWAVIIFLLATFFFVAFRTFTIEPAFKSTGVIKVSAQAPNITNLGNVRRDYLTSREAFETQVQLLQRGKLIKRTINVLGLKNTESFYENKKNVQNNTAEDQSIFSGIKKFFSTIKNRIKEIKNGIKEKIKRIVPSILGTEDEVKPELKATDAMAEHVLDEKLLNKFRRQLKITPMQDTQLIQISFESSSAVLSAKVVNALIQQFIKVQLETNVDSYQVANAFLQKQMQAAQVKLEESESTFNEFARNAGIISMDAGNNLILRQLAEVNNALAQAKTDRIIKESYYRQILKDGGKNLPQILDDELIRSLKAQYAILYSEYQDLSTTFKPGYPRLKKLEARMNDLKSRYESETRRMSEILTAATKNEYVAALENENRLSESLDKQKEMAMALNEKSIEYNILLREVEANKQIYKSLLNRSKTVEASVGSDVSNVEIVDPARIPTRPFKPKTFRNLLLGILLGLGGGVGVAFLLEFLDSTIKKPDEFVHRYHIPVLGLIPLEQDGKNGDEVSVAFKAFNDPRSPLSEAIRTTMVSIKLSSANQNLKTIMVTSVLPDAGKSTIATNLALSMLSDSSQALIIDTDMRKPTLHRFFKHAKNDVGLSSFLSGIDKVEDIIFESGIENLNFVPSGPLPLNPAELIASGRMRSFLKLMTDKFDHVIIDTPPFHGFAEILILANMVDGVILISELNKTPRDGLQYFRQAVTNVDGNILGVMINKVAATSSYGGYGGYGSGYGGYGYGRK